MAQNQMFIGRLCLNLETVNATIRGANLRNTGTHVRSRASHISDTLPGRAIARIWGSRTDRQSVGGSISLFGPERC